MGMIFSSALGVTVLTGHHRAEACLTLKNKIHNARGEKKRDPEHRRVEMVRKSKR
jgi:hypothetical protein